MSKYHSRSPEEFKKYIEGLNQKPKKRNWRNIIYFVDIALLMFVFYMISKIINPAADIQLKASTKINYEQIEIYFAKSNVIEKDLSNYFLFIKNLENKEYEFKGLKGIFVMRSEIGDECLKKEILFPGKIIQNHSLDSISFSVPKVSKENLSENCRSIYRKPSFPKTVETIFDFSQKYRIDAYLYLTMDKGTMELILTDEIWK